MNTLETRQYAMLVRVRDFGKNHPDLFPEHSVGAESLTEIGKAVEEASVHAQAALSTEDEGIIEKQDARKALRKRLLTISRTARTIGKRRSDFPKSFRLLHRQTDEQLLDTGRMFARDGERLKETFLAHGLRGTFVAHLTAAVDRFAKAKEVRELGVQVETGARTAMANAIPPGLDAVRTLDTLMVNQLADDPNTLSQWEKARRMEYPRRRRTAAPTSAPVAPVPAAAAAPAAVPAKTEAGGAEAAKPALTDRLAS